MKKLLLVSLCALAFVAMFTAGVSAAPSDPNQTGSIGLEGIVKGNPPNSAPTITSPSNGQNITTLPTKVSGLCVSDLLIKVFKNEVFAGSAQCVGGAYSLNIDLFSGKNDLIARAYDALDQVSPDSNLVSVTYTVGGFNTDGPRVTLTSDYAKRGTNPNETLTWPILLSGGTGPYAISVDWGDGKTELISRLLAGPFDLSHVYTTAGIYTIIIKGTDSKGNSAFLQLVGVANGALSQDNQSNSQTIATRIIYIWWPLIVAAVLVVVSYWLGGRSKLKKLRLQADKQVRF